MTDADTQPPTGNTKGIGVVNAREWVLSHHGEAQWSAVEAELTDADRELVSSVVTVGWIPFGTYARLLRSIDRVVGTGDLAIVRTISAYQAERDLKTVYRMLLRFKSPAYVIEKTGYLWRRYHDTGVFTARRDSECQATGILEGWAGAAEGLCVDNVAVYTRKTLELVGAEDVSVDHPKCRGRGSDRCEFVARWR